jgi:hypothetical protein
MLERLVFEELLGSRFPLTVNREPRHWTGTFMNDFSRFHFLAAATTAVLLLSACTAETSPIRLTDVGTAAAVVVSPLIKARALVAPPPLIDHSSVDWSKVPLEPDPSSF